MTNSVAERSKASTEMLIAGQTGRHLMGGTKAMRSAGEVYLPKFEAESGDGYLARLNCSWLFNGYRKTVRDMSGRVFDKPVRVEEENATLQEWLTNVDLQGNDLSVFAKDLFEDALSAYGLSFVLVDAPKREGETTRAEASALNLRPYLSLVKLENLLGWKSEIIGNVPKLTQVRIHEMVNEPDPSDEFTEVQVEQVRVFDLVEGRVQVRIYRPSSESQWAIYDQYGTDLEEITLATFYVNRTGFMAAEPLLDDLADINVAHWQSQSDQRNILHAARVPILVRTGVDEETAQIEIGAGVAMDLSNEAGKVFWAEHSGRAIGAGRQDLKDLEFQMETFGLQLLAARAQSATGEALDAKKETSQLAMIADALKDCLERVLAWMCDMGGLGIEPTVYVNKEFGVSMLTAQELTALLSAVNTGNLSRRTFLAEMQRRGAISEDVLLDDEEDRIEADSEGLMVDGVSE